MNVFNEPGLDSGWVPCIACSARQYLLSPFLNQEYNTKSGSAATTLENSGMGQNYLHDVKILT